jgi:two-component system sensor histidine kinase MprB
MNRRPGLRARLALMSAAAVAIAIAAVSLLAWWATAQTMRTQVDRALTSGPLSGRFMQPGGPYGSGGPTDPEQLCRTNEVLATALQPVIGSLQVVRSDGSVCGLSPQTLVAATSADIAAARGGPATKVRDDTTRAGAHVRVITVPMNDGYAMMLSRDLTEMDTTLRTLALALLLASGLGALGALTAGWAVARAGLRPLNDLTRAAEHIAVTQDLRVPIAVTGDDEVARLALSFNKMTTALEGARDRQHQMIADASHELRTPLTSLRTNIELLIRSEDEARALPPADRRALLGSLSGQVQELSSLASELSLLAHDEPVAQPVVVRLDEVVHQAVQRASRRGRHLIHSDLQPWYLIGEPAALERAVLNLLDNAIKFSPPRSTVRVRLRDGFLDVADEGPGIPEAERAQVFQRFWRSPSSRAMPGSGLGLAIVADVVTGHGGEVSVDRAPTGGALVTIRLPGHREPPPPSEEPQNPAEHPDGPGRYPTRPPQDSAELQDRPPSAASARVRPSPAALSAVPGPEGSDQPPV